jgi:hypothetical protein
VKKDRTSLKQFAVELLIYAALVFGYFFLVLHFLSTWLKDLFDQNKKYYAVVALVLIVAQGILLETITTGLLNFIKSKIR